MLVVIIIEKVGWYLGNHLLKQKLCNFYLNAYLFSQEGTVSTQMFIGDNFA